MVEEAGPEELPESGEDEGEDFEDSMPQLRSTAPGGESGTTGASQQTSIIGPYSYSRPSAARTGSLNTIKLQRRTRLAEKLREVFELPGIEEVYAGMPIYYFGLHCFIDVHTRTTLLASALCS